MRIVTLSAIMATGLLAAVPGFAQSTPDSTKQATQSMAHPADVTKQPAQSMAHPADVTKQPAQSMAHPAGVTKQAAQSLAHGNPASVDPSLKQQ